MATREKWSPRSADTPKITALHNPFPPRESWSLRSPETPKITDTQAHPRDKLRSETARSTNIRDKQMARDKHKNLSNKNQDDLASSEPSSPITPNTGFSYSGKA